MNQNKITAEVKTVTVLYYDAPAGLVMHNDVLQSLPVNANGRVLLTDEFREGKSIIAVLEGECKILNSLGERVYETKVLTD
ncbi:TIGR02922 family protein [Parashewanella spongiae]|uniref:TIGR02922 family protein n=1 Tax=Parashewanella spongiae TaxID=342950 RepID=A0A3A6TKD9_9GAMM|nr:TIGR02922 family protein [Parashewanella spongiae]MCL1079153.1 TIGR02922 family protein [Parashewanella spongiae]RJY10757.1 TIGR02922 family protein [Parashewanella spongiae]